MVMQGEKNISHEDFKWGIIYGIIKFEIVDKKKLSELVHKPLIKILDPIFSILSLPVFVITIPILAYAFDKWILLIGFVGYFLGLILHRICISARQQKKRIKRSIIAACSFGFLTFILIYSFGFLNIFSFISTCALYKFLVSNIWINLWVETAINNLVNNADKYYYSVNNNIIKPDYH